MIYGDLRVLQQLKSLVFDDDVKSRQMKAYRLMQIIMEIEQEVTE